MVVDISWDKCVEEAVNVLESREVLRSLRPIYMSRQNEDDVVKSKRSGEDEYEVFDGLCRWDRNSVEVSVSIPTFQKWLHDEPSNGEESFSGDALAESRKGKFKKLLLFSGNDYLGLSSHPTISNVAANALQEYGMGPKGSALICGYTTYHRMLETSLAELKKKEDCLVCPTGFAANMAAMVAIGNVSSLLAASGKPLKSEKVAIFSDALNHASIIDGIRLAERQGNVEVFVYRHCDMYHLKSLLSSCEMKRKVVVTDSLFSMDGDFAPMEELSQLRKKHGFLLVIDDAHGTFVCGENGNGSSDQNENQGMDHHQTTSSSCMIPNCIVPAVSCFHPRIRRRKKKTDHRNNGPELVAEPVDVRSMSFVGTHEYLAPEIVSGEGHGSAVDWWTLGIFMFEMFYGTTPFKGMDHELTLANIVARALEFPKEPTIPSAAKDLISQLLAKDPNRRLGSSLGATAVKRHPFFQGVNWALLMCTRPPFVPPPFRKDLLSDDICPETHVDYY